MRELRQLAEMRNRLEDTLSGLTPEQLFRVPEGFGNHIAWNAAHVIVTQQLLCYGLSGLEPLLHRDLIDRYRKGTGADTADEGSYRAVLALLHEGPRRLRADYEAGRFVRFRRYMTSAGIALAEIEDAISFNNIHEGIHLGYILAQRKLVAA